MTYSVSIVMGICLLVVVDIFGSIASKHFRFNYAYLSVLSIAMALSPLILCSKDISPLQASIYSAVIFGPETFFGVIIASRINAYCGSGGSYRDVMNKTGIRNTYVACVSLWVALALIVYFVH